MPFSREKQIRVCRAIQENIDHWLTLLSEAEKRAIPGNKAGLLAIMVSMEQAKQSIGRIMATDQEPPPT